jgi:hypothetical protein
MVTPRRLSALGRSSARQRVQQRARRHDDYGVRGNVGNVDSATYRI